jgi:putative monooxygenase
MKHIVQKEPVRIPTNDNKIIEEFYGFASANAGNFSFAHMIAPGGWTEPFQTPEFDEITYVISGRKKFELDGEEVILGKNEAIVVKKGSRVRYSNPFKEECEYISVCIPPFSMDKVNRE